MDYLQDETTQDSLRDSGLVGPIDLNSDPNLDVSEFYQTGGYCLTSTQMMDYLFQTDRIADVVFDPVEELIWCISKTGQLSAFYSTNLERYITTTVPLVTNVNSLENGSPYTELKQVLPSSNPLEHSVFILANNALHAFAKSGRSLASAMDKRMLDLECLTAAGPTGALVGGNMWNGSGNISRFFLGGLQSNLLELDACDRWGDVIHTIDVGAAGSVILKPFSCGLCAGNTNGKVLLIDSRTSSGVVREIDAHTGEISDITVDGRGYTLVTSGWSRLGESGLRVDRLLRVYDLRSGRARLPLSSSLDPCFARFIPGCSDNLLTASQTGGLQTIHWGETVFSPDDLGQLWFSYDRLLAMDISQNGNCAIFGTEAGQLQLYLHDINMCQFNLSPIPTLFASSCAESLLVTNNLTGAIPSDYPVLSTDDPNNILYGTNLALIGKSASDAASLQHLLTTSLHPPHHLSHESITNEMQNFSHMVERRKVEAAHGAINTAYKPVDFDDYRFALASSPFSANPPPVFCPLDMNREEKTYSFGMKPKEMCTSDWPVDLRPTRPRMMVSVDSDLLNNANQKHAVRKPSSWGNVWHPYPSLDIPLNKIKNTYTDLKPGRFVDITDINV